MPFFPPQSGVALVGDEWKCLQPGFSNCGPRSSCLSSNEKTKAAGALSSGAVVVFKASWRSSSEPGPAGG